MSNRFQKIRELGCKGQKSNPLMLDEFQWYNEWVDENCEETTWVAVDEAIGASENLHRNLPRAATARAAASVSQMYTRKRPMTAAAAATTPDIIDDEDDDHEAQV
jgi:hypothetical protein